MTGTWSDPMQTAAGSLRSFSYRKTSIDRALRRWIQPISHLIAAFFMLAGPAAMLTPAIADGVGPLSIAKTGHFFAGGKYVETKDGPVLAGQAYVEYYIPTNQTHPYPIVMIEGCCLAGAGYMGTPDGRDGWGQYFLSKGYAIYIMDQVGRGRSPYVEAVYGPKIMRSPKFVERDFIAYEKYNLYPQAKLHTQWPGPGTVGDPVFDQFMAETLPMIGDSKLREAVNRDATIALLDKIGPAILMPHSQSAAPVWLVADARPQLVKALLMVEAGTSLFYEVKLVGAPEWFKDGGLSKPFGVTYAPITYDPPVKSVEDFGLVRQEKPDAPDLPRCWQQKEPAHKLINIKNIPTLQMSAEASFGAPTAHCNAAFLKSAGVPVDFIRLADIGIHGNGHFLMLEKNNMEIAAVIADWLNKHVTPAEAAAGQKTTRP
jgi:pimeloyl-ACP methyl ester carboxylesterase